MLRRHAAGQMEPTGILPQGPCLLGGHRAGLLVEVIFKQVLQLTRVERGDSIRERITDSGGSKGLYS